MNKINGGYLKRKRTNKYVSKKKSYPRYRTLPNEYNYIKAELVDTIGIYVSGPTSTFVFQNSGVSYIPLQVIIGTSSSFVQHQTEYTRYKITGVSVECAQASSPEHLRLGFLLGAPAVAMAFYPQNTTQSMANAPALKDNNFLMYPNVGHVQRKYWGIPDGYMDTGSNGLGTWNSTNSITNQTGQLHIAPVDSGNTNIAVLNVFLLRFCVYVIFSGKMD